MTNDDEKPRILAINDMPTCFRVEGIGVHVEGNGGYHESLLRAWNILNKVKELLELGTPQSVIQEMIAVMESRQYPDNNNFTIRVDSSEYYGQELLARVKAATAAHENDSEVSNG